MNSRLSFIADLKKCIDDVLDDEYSLGMYATDASHYQILPVAVILPKDESEVGKAVEIAGNYKIKILPRGGGISLAGQTVGVAVGIEFSKYMTNILEFNEQGKWV